MPKFDFSKKIISDNVHGSVGISELEQELANTRTFRRLKKINHLGLANLVFPGAEHSRFAHSIGVMHIMSIMVDRLRAEGCKYLRKDFNNTKQKLRLAALLHDIGHFPLSHLGERVFKWVDVIQESTEVTRSKSRRYRSYRLLQSAVKDYPSTVAKHEKLGEIILTNEKSELRRILVDHNFDPAEIARIINGEETSNVFFVQLMCSTLDCDRMDYMLRDAVSTGTSYGQIDLEYILRNLTWDKRKERICFYPKALNAIEHFIASRYFYYNIIYHKTIMGFELMAKALFYSMIMDRDFNAGDYNGIVHSFKDIMKKMNSDANFLANFNDEYFWYYLDLYKPKNRILRKLKKYLLTRTPLRPIYSTKALKSKSRGYYDRQYDFLTENIFENRDFNNCLSRNNIPKSLIAILERKVKFEEIEFAISFENINEISEEDRLKLVRIKHNSGSIELIAHEGSIIKILSEYQPHIATLYALVDIDSKEEKALKGIVKKLCKRHGR